MSTKKLSKRSLNYLAIIGDTQFGAYRGIIPWPTERILRDQKLVTKLGEDRGISILRITDAGRAALATPSPELPRLTTNWQDPETGEVMWSGKPTWGELRDALELAGRVLTGIRDGEAIHFFQGDGDKAINMINALLARCQRRVDSPAGEETRGNGHH